MQKRVKGTKRKTRQAKALEARKAPRTFLELLQEVKGGNDASIPPDFFASLSELNNFSFEGKSGVFASSCSILFEGSSGTSKLYLPTAFLQRLWIYCRLYMRDMWNALLFNPVPKYT